ncbi:hypothetical protein [Sorangium sp. So ce131]|uniref:hypothetical protein n=1 Tax=Sorangium sp. So ce131 TaxID=3133282 RepID=UPI003F61DA37
MRRMRFEMGTSDPDDVMTLLWLADHPDVELLGVLVTPGSQTARGNQNRTRWTSISSRPSSL